MSTKAKINQKKKVERKNKEWLQKELQSIVPQKEEKIVVETESDDEAPFVDIADLPFIPIKGKHQQQESSAPDDEDDKDPTVVYLGHLPFGFEEYQMAEYFRQFGTVKRSFISRSKKTGHSRGYGFVEFNHSETAQIAADVMNDYLMDPLLLPLSLTLPFMFKRRLICRLVPITAASRIKWSESPMRPSTLFAVQRGAAMMYNKKNPLRPLGRLVDREEKKRMKLKKLGINYEFDGYTALVNQLNANKEKAKKKKDEGRQEEEQENTDEQKKPEEEKKKAKGEKRKEKEAEEDDEEEEVDEEKIWQERKKTKLAQDLTTKQKHQLMNEELKAARKRTAKTANETQAKTAEASHTSTTTPAKAKPTPKNSTPAKDVSTHKNNTPAKNKSTQKDNTPAKEKSTLKVNTPAKEESTSQKNTTPAKQSTPQTEPKKRAASTHTNTRATQSAKKNKVNGSK